MQAQDENYTGFPITPFLIEVSIPSSKGTPAPLPSPLTSGLLGNSWGPYCYKKGEV